MGSMGLTDERMCLDAKTTVRRRAPVPLALLPAIGGGEPNLPLSNCPGRSPAVSGTVSNQRTDMDKKMNKGTALQKSH